MTRKATPARCAIYLRISLDATGQGLAVDRQREDCRRIASERGWTVVGEYVDNSVSASDKRKDRPAYDRMVRDYMAGSFDALVCWDLDRLTRQPRKLEDWIDAAEDRGLVLVTANGEADLSTDGGRLFARIKASVGRAEVDRKAARQARAALQRSEHGKPPSGVRLTGYATNGDLVPAEAALVRKMFDRFLAGDSLRGITVWLTESGVATRRGSPWNPSAVRSILTNPRYAGRAIYRGAATGKSGNWRPIVDDATFDVVQAKLADPRRRTQVGTDRKYLGSGLYRCGVCEAVVYSHSGARYRCPAGGHVTRLAASVDAYVLGVLRARLTGSDLAGLLREPESDAARELAGEVKRLRARLVSIENDYDDGLIDARRFRVASEKVRVQLTSAEIAHVRLMGSSGLAPLLHAPNPASVFDAAPLGIQREVLALLMTVTLHPTPRGHKFNPESVEIEWRLGA